MTYLHSQGDAYEIKTNEHTGYDITGEMFSAHYSTLEDILYRCCFDKYVYGTKISNETLKRIGRAILNTNNVWYINEDELK